MFIQSDVRVVNEPMQRDPTVQAAWCKLWTAASTLGSSLFASSDASVARARKRSRTAIFSRWRLATAEDEYDRPWVEQVQKQLVGEYDRLKLADLAPEQFLNYGVEVAIMLLENRRVRAQRAKSKMARRRSTKLARWREQLSIGLRLDEDEDEVLEGTAVSINLYDPTTLLEELRDSFRSLSYATQVALACAPMPLAGKKS